MSFTTSYLLLIVRAMKHRGGVEIRHNIYTGNGVDTTFRLAK